MSIIKKSDNSIYEGAFLFYKQNNLDIQPKIDMLEFFSILGKYSLI